jgi:RNA polymerase sigma factor (TIGR02999 family)
MGDNVTKLLHRIEQGDRQATAQLLPLVCDELRRLAAGKMNQPTALIHEAFVRLVGSLDLKQWDGRAYFFAAAAEAMRRILVENARRCSRQKQNGKFVRCELNEHDAASALWSRWATRLRLTA